MAVTLTKPFPCTHRERRFMDIVNRFLKRGGTYKALISMIDAISSADRVAAYERLLAEVTNPVDRQLFEAGLSVVQGGEA